MQYLAIGVRCFLAAIFLVSFASKVSGRAAFTAFEASVAELSPFPAFSHRATAVLVLCVEGGVFVLIAMPSGTAVRSGCVAALGIVLAFTFAIIPAVRKKGIAGCRCFGSSKTPPGVHHLVRNLVIIVIAATGITLTPALHRPAAGGVVISVCAGLLMSAVIIMSDDLVELFRLPPRTR